MELAEAVRRRRMVRSYTDEPVDPAAVRRALEHAVRAPSAGFTQGWAFLLLDTGPDVAAFWAAATPPGGGADAWSRGMRTAPVVLVVLSSKRAYLDRYAEPDKERTHRDEASWPVPYWHVDAGMAALLVLLTAVDEGLGGCLFGIPGERVAHLRAAFAVPADHDPVGAITLGHPGGHPAPGGVPGSAARRRRRPLDELVHRGRW